MLFMTVVPFTRNVDLYLKKVIENQVTSSFLCYCVIGIRIKVFLHNRCATIAPKYKLH